MKNLVFLFCLTIPIQIFAWSGEGLLLQTIINLPEDTNQVKSYNNKAAELQYLDPVSALKYSDSAIILSSKMGWDKGLALGFKNRGNVYLNVNDSKKALNDFIVVLEIAKRLNDKNLEARAEGSLGNVYLNQLKYYEAYAHYSKASELFQMLGDVGGESIALGNLGNVFERTTEYRKSLEMYAKSFALSIQSNNLRQAAYALNNIGGIYNKLNKQDSALLYFNQVLALVDADTTLLDFKGGVLSNIGQLYLDSSNYDQAYKIFEEALLIAHRCSKHDLEFVAINNIGSIYMRKMEYLKALDYFTRSLNIADSIERPEYQAEIRNNIGYAYQMMKRYSVAIPYYDAAWKIADEYNLKEIKRNSERLRSESQELARQHELFVQYLFIGFLLVYFIMFIYLIVIKDMSHGFVRTIGVIGVAFFSEFLASIVDEFFVKIIPNVLILNLILFTVFALILTPLQDKILRLFIKSD